jgi:hypothetical protein
MSLLPDNTPDPAQYVAAFIDEARTTAIVMLASMLKNSFLLLWDSRDVTPQQIVDKFGINAGTIFANHAACVTFLLSLDANALHPSEYTPPYKFTINEDGTVTIGDLV